MKYKIYKVVLFLNVHFIVTIHFNHFLLLLYYMYKYIDSTNTNC